ncbi:MAG: DUF2867 domain-containing protein [Pseudomonadota bacterium]
MRQFASCALARLCIAGVDQHGLTKMFCANVKTTSLNSESRLWDRVCQGDFIDCYTVAADATPRQAAEIITSFPGWAQGLLVIRRFVTAPFGLSNDGPAADDKLGPFPVELENDNEIIAGFDDKHLDFRVCVFSRDGEVSLATWVHTNNFGGRAYLAAIMPFHILIAKDALRRVASASLAHEAQAL